MQFVLCVGQAYSNAELVYANELSGVSLVSWNLECNDEDIILYLKC